MSHYTIFDHFHLLRRKKEKELHEFYLFVLIGVFGFNLMAVFVPVYLYKIGYSIEKILLFFFLISFYFVLFGYIGAKITGKIGIKHTILFSTPFVIAYFVGLNYLESAPFLFFVLPAFKAIRMIFYNYGYHLNFLINSSKKSRGHQLSFLGVITTIVSSITPLISGFMIFYFGFNVVFVIGSTFILLSVVPMFFSEDEYNKIEFDGKSLFGDFLKKENKGMILSFTGYAIESIIGKVLWPVFLIILLLTTKKMGIVLTLSALATVLVFYLVGIITDNFDKKKLLRITTVFYFFTWIGRIFASNVMRIFAIDTLKGMIDKFHLIPWSVYSYDLAQKRDGFRFIVFREICYNLARIVFMPILMLFFVIDYHPFLLSFIFASFFSLLYMFIIEEKKRFIQKLFNFNQ